MTDERLEALERDGWRLTRDGSTGTAFLAWDDPDDPESGWELLVFHTAGHGNRFSLNVNGAGLSERPLPDLRRLTYALSAATELLQDWRGELLDDREGQ